MNAALTVVNVVSLAVALTVVNVVSLAVALTMVNVVKGAVAFTAALTVVNAVSLAAALTVVNAALTVLTVAIAQIVVNAALTVVKEAVLMNKVKETSTNQLDMGSLTQIKSFDEEINKLSEILVKLNPITEQISNRIAFLRTDASYYSGMIDTDIKAFQKWFNQSNYKQNLSGIRTLINTAAELLSDEGTDDTSDIDYAWMDACGESTICYYEYFCSQICAYTPDCNETVQDEYTVDDDGGIVCTLSGEGCTETCGECGETTVPDPISECALPGCDDAGCMEQIACGELCTETIDCDQTVCDVCSHMSSICDEGWFTCNDGVCSLNAGTNVPDDCNFTCLFTGSDINSTGCTFTCTDASTPCNVSDCSYTSTTLEGIDFVIPCDEPVNCNQPITCTHACGLTVCDDSVGCGETCEHNAEDCGDCFFGGCEAGDGDCGDCADCGDCSDCGDGWCSHDCADGTDTCGEPCGDSCGL